MDLSSTKGSLLRSLEAQGSEFRVVRVREYRPATSPENEAFSRFVSWFRGSKG